MSTSAQIIYKREGPSLEKYGEIERPYSHINVYRDGHIETLGKILFDYYKTYKDVETLVSFGNLSSIEPDNTIHAYASKEFGQLYHNNAPRNYNKLNELLSEEFNYVFENGEWYVRYLEEMGKGFGEWAHNGEWVNLSRFFKQSPKPGGFRRRSNPHHSLDIGKDRDHVLVSESFKNYYNL